ncbi:MAG: SOS response-associated peptidase [Candidatus Marinimicrobia bacterium]|nr:SOS response-associated peptidase [Candidatus Neomarinimicrobiota bacterium]MCF7829153.1 SOS response-associated peptidase [Candidatus Neomarinimicrobiota bacterium]MCF7881194.1 SOS response-associated peptidase [Candidatus Neomarinimicrobiota bacterium]
MCGRVSLTKAIEPVEQRFNVKYTGDREWPIYYNGAPSQYYPVITNENPEQIQLFRWGLIPSWSKQPETKYSMINAKAETLEEKRSYKGPFQKRRCLVIVDGFYEWKKTGNSKQPYRIRLENESLFAFAGLYEIWKNDEQVLPSFTIITTEPNSVMENIHNRMPVILPKEVELQWLDNSLETDELKPLLRPYPKDDLTAYPVSKIVNNPKNNQPDVIRPIDDSTKNDPNDTGEDGQAELF